MGGDLYSSGNKDYCSEIQIGSGDDDSDERHGCSADEVTLGFAHNPYLNSLSVDQI